MNLEQFFKENPKVAIGFSGGVDSSYLLYAGLKYGADMMAYYVESDFQPKFEISDAQNLAEQVGASLKIIKLNVLSNETISSNPPNRCYHCKLKIFGTIKEQAKIDGFPTLIDGTNFSDDASDRPGMKALEELQVRSPLRECQITKDEIRRLAREAKLITCDKPSYACLATRIPTGNLITPEILKRVENAENSLFELGFSDFRVRVFHDAARLQFPKNEFESVMKKREQILKVVKSEFDVVLLDLEGR